MMKDADVNYFLDTLYYNDHTVIYNNKKYFFNPVCTDEDGISHFEIYKSDMNDENSEVIYSIANPNVEVCARDFLDKKIFDGKSFWEVESEMTEVDG